LMSHIIIVASHDKIVWPSTIPTGQKYISNTIPKK
jgi:hypothetical protein